MTDAFLLLAKQPMPPKITPKVAHHSERAHSKFSASGSERWFECPGSVELSEGLPDKSSPWAEEGTKAHEALEKVMSNCLPVDPGHWVSEHSLRVMIRDYPQEMVDHVMTSAKFILDLAVKNNVFEVLVETKIYLDFIHPEMFGTFDGAVVDHFGTLHVFDFKYGAGVFVPVKENLQMIFYGIGLAHRYHWNFKRVRLWIIQPRIKGYDGPTFWDISILELRAYVDLFKKAVDRVLKATGRKEDYREGSWCHWCKCKSICPLKREAKLEKAQAVFGLAPFER